jgi:hypothetical protein
MVSSWSISLLRGFALIAALTVVAAVIAVSLIFKVGTANAYPYPWCAVYDDSGDTNCGFVSLEQCRASISGIGGFCELYTPAPVGHRQPRLKDLPADVLQHEQTLKPENKLGKDRTICRGC